MVSTHPELRFPIIRIVGFLSAGQPGHEDRNTQVLSSIAQQFANDPIKHLPKRTNWGFAFIISLTLQMPHLAFCLRMIYTYHTVIQSVYELVFDI